MVRILLYLSKLITNIVFNYSPITKTEIRDMKNKHLPKQAPVYGPGAAGKVGGVNAPRRGQW